MCLCIHRPDQFLCTGVELQDTALMLLICGLFVSLADNVEFTVLTVMLKVETMVHLIVLS